jgi:hypothetical protein
MKLVTVIAAFLALSSPAMAAERSLMTVWMIDDRAAVPETRDLRSGDFVFKQRLLPAGLARIAVGAASPGPSGLADGRQLIELQSDVPVFCDPVIGPKKLIGHGQTCLIDADRDGRFEGMFLTSSVTKGILTIQGKRPKTAKAIAPVAYRRLDPTEFEEDLFVGLQYRGNANLFGNEVFEIKYGSAERTGSLTKRLLHKKANIPGSTDFLGGRFTILESTPQGIRVRIDKPMPRQPFGVIQTTTYHFY